jgi:hypothetical protein
MERLHIGVYCRDLLRHSILWHCGGGGHCVLEIASFSHSDVSFQAS